MWWSVVAWSAGQDETPDPEGPVAAAEDPVWKRTAAESAVAPRDVARQERRGTESDATAGRRAGGRDGPATGAGGEGDLVSRLDDEEDDSESVYEESERESKEEAEDPELELGDSRRPLLAAQAVAVSSNSTASG